MSPPSPRRRALLGLLALTCYALHAGHYLAAGAPQNLLWVCHLGCALVGLGWLLGSSAWNGMGVLWLSYGFPLWILDLLTGGELLPTSCATHVGGLTLGLLGVSRLGPPRGVWWRASLGAMLLMLVTRLVAPPQDNVNLAFRVWPGWEGRFHSFPVYLLVVIGGGTLVLFVAERALRRLAPARGAAPPPGEGVSAGQPAAPP